MGPARLYSVKLSIDDSDLGKNDTTVRSSAGKMNRTVTTQAHKGGAMSSMGKSPGPQGQKYGIVSSDMTQKQQNMYYNQLREASTHLRPALGKKNDFISLSNSQVDSENQSQGAQEISVEVYED